MPFFLDGVAMKRDLKLGDGIHPNAQGYKKITENIYPYVVQAIEKRGRVMKESSSIAKAANEIILESISDGVFTVDHNWRIMSFNRAAEEITGTSRSEAIGRYCWEVFRSNMCEGDCALKRTMKEGKSFVSSSTYIINNRQQRVPIGVSTSPLKNEKGEILGGVETFRDHSLVEELRRELIGNFEVGDMVSRSKGMKKIFNILQQVAESDSTVLIEGRNRYREGIDGLCPAQSVFA